MVIEQRRAAQRQAEVFDNKYCNIKDAAQVISAEYARATEHLRGLGGTIAPYCENLPSDAVKLVIEGKVDEVLHLLSAPSDIVTTVAQRTSGATKRAGP